MAYRIPPNDLTNGSQIYLLCGVLLEEKQQFYIGCTKNKPRVHAHPIANNTYVCYARHINNSHKHKKALLEELKEYRIPPRSNNSIVYSKQWLEGISFWELTSIIDTYITYQETCPKIKLKDKDFVHYYDNEDYIEIKDDNDDMEIDEILDHPIVSYKSNSISDNIPKLKLNSCNNNKYKHLYSDSDSDLSDTYSITVSNNKKYKVDKTNIIDNSNNTVQPIFQSKPKPKPKSETKTKPKLETKPRPRSNMNTRGGSYFIESTTKYKPLSMLDVPPVKKSYSTLDRFVKSTPATTNLSQNNNTNQLLTKGIKRKKPDE